MKKISKTALTVVCTFALMFGTALSSNAAVCNSPCPDPCAPSQTVCEGTNCTTYCAKSTVYGTSNYTLPAVSFSYSTPNVSFSVSNEVYGIYNYYSRPNFTITNGFRPIYHRPPSRPVVVHKPAPKPVSHITHKKPPKPAPDMHKRPAQNVKPAPKSGTQRPPQKPKK